MRLKRPRHIEASVSAEDFSTSQMRNMVKRNQLTVKLDDINDRMNREILLDGLNRSGYDPSSSNRSAVVAAQRHAKMMDSRRIATEQAKDYLLFSKEDTLRMFEPGSSAAPSLAVEEEATALAALPVHDLPPEASAVFDEQFLEETTTFGSESEGDTRDLQDARIDPYQRGNDNSDDEEWNEVGVESSTTRSPEDALVDVKVNEGEEKQRQDSTSDQLSDAEHDSENLSDGEGKSFVRDRHVPLDADRPADYSNPLQMLGKKRAPPFAIVQTSLEMDVEEPSEVVATPETPEIIEAEHAHPPPSLPAFDPLATEAELDALMAAHRKQETQVNMVTADMVDDIHHLLHLMGIPFIVAPAEAEAQCATLDTLGLVDGVVTDDSDVFLFGAQRVYRQMFSRGAGVQIYQASTILRALRMNRERMIAVSYLTGSDYSDGIEHVGIVAAVEILQLFEIGRASDASCISGLRRFRDWWSKARESSASEESDKTKRGLVRSFFTA